MIQAVVVNHNTSMFTELSLRSFVTTNDCSDVRITVVDNGSTDDGFGPLLRAAESVGASLVRSRWPIVEHNVNTHGDGLRDFVLGAQPDTEAFLLLNADVAFIEPGSLQCIRQELDADPDAWAVRARFDWSEDHYGPGGSLDVSAGTPVEVRTEVHMAKPPSAAPAEGSSTRADTQAARWCIAAVPTGRRARGAVRCRRAERRPRASRAA